MQQLYAILSALFAAFSRTGAMGPKAEYKSYPRLNSKGQPIEVVDVSSIKAWEQLRLKAYMPTPNDKWTIGWGHTGTARAGMVITEAEAERLLKSDLGWAKAAVHKEVDVPLSQEQFDALVSLTFNIGGANFARSTVVRRLNAKDYRGAADAFLRWDKQRNKRTGRLEVLKGLVRRRKHERDLFLKGTR